MPLSVELFLALVVAGLLMVGLVAFDALSRSAGGSASAPGGWPSSSPAALLGSLINVPAARLRVEAREISAPVPVFGVTITRAGSSGEDSHEHLPGRPRCTFLPCRQDSAASAPDAG